MVLAYMYESGGGWSLRFNGVLPTPVHGDTILHLLLHGRDQSTVLGSKGIEKAELAISHKASHVVPEARAAKTRHR